MALDVAATRTLLGCFYISLRHPISFCYFKDNREKKHDSERYNVYIISYVIPCTVLRRKLFSEPNVWQTDKGLQARRLSNPNRFGEGDFHLFSLLPET